MEALVKAMNQGAYEREETIALALLAAMAGESIFLLGLPGVGKSMIARRVKLAFRDARSFEYLMSRFSTPDEIFGPVSITKLKDEDTYERVTEGYLPTADVVFLDEIWKAGPAIQNSLLTALNERIFHNGNHDMNLPLKTIISASNELPAEGEGLEALWDRFLIRYIVEPISDKQAFLQLLTEREQPCDVDDCLAFTDDELMEIKVKADVVTIPKSILDVICKLREILNNSSQADKMMPASQGFPYVSDRRWRKIIGILRMSAYLNGRKEINASDCLLLEHMIWDSDDQISGVRKMVAESIVESLAIEQPSSILADDLNTSNVTRPIGNLLSPDGTHYVFSAGGEDVMISKVDYETLSHNTSFGKMGVDNVLHITEENGEFTVRKTREGNIVLNSFTYMLKRDNPLRTGNTDILIDAVNAGADEASSQLLNQIKDNIFLRHASTYTDLSDVFNKVRIDKNYFKRRK